MRAYIWDLDGTLLNSYGVIVEGAVRTAAEAGLDDSAEDVLKAVKQGSVSGYLRALSAECGKSTEALYERYRTVSHARMKKQQFAHTA